MPRVARAVALSVLVVLSLIVWVPEPASGRAPACTEYCYEPIPVPGGDPDGAGQGAGQPDGPPTSGKDLSAAEQALGVVAAATVGGGNGNGGGGPGGSDSAAQDPGSSSVSQRGTSGTWIALAVVLGLGTIALLFIGIRRMRADGLSRGDVLLRGLALTAGLGLVFLLSPGVSGASASKAPKSFFGMMSIDGIDETDASRMAAGGVSTYRFPMSWDSVQPNASSAFDWGLADATVRVGAAAGLRLLPIAAATPKGFASNWTELPITTQAQRQGWAKFLRGAIERYGPKGEFWAENPDLPKRPIRTWQVWNEANFFYFTEPVVAADYFKLLKASHKIIKQEDPGAKVMLSGLYGSPPNDPRRSMKSWQFLAKLYKLGAKKYFDSVAIHPYSPDTTQLRLIIEKVRSTMNRYGGKKTQIDITEIGWGSDSRTSFGKGSAKAQAQQLTSAYDFMTKNRKKLGIRSAYWFAWQDVSRQIDTCSFCYSTGLFEAGDHLVAKPAWRAFVKFTGGRS